MVFSGGRVLSNLTHLTANRVGDRVRGPVRDALYDATWDRSNLQNDAWDKVARPITARLQRTWWVVPHNSLG